MEFPRLVELHEKYESMGVQFVSIDTGAEGPAARSFVEEQGARHIILSDPNDEASGAYGIFAIPVTVLIDHEGRAVFRHIGYTDEIGERMDGEIRLLLEWMEAA